MRIYVLPCCLLDLSACWVVNAERTFGVTYTGDECDLENTRRPPTPRGTVPGVIEPRSHVARGRVRAELLAEAAGAPVVTAADVFGAAVLADLAASVAGADTGGHD